MEKDILIQNLKTKVGEDNCKVISDKTFDGIAESVLPMFADDSKITDETWKLPVATLIQFAGQKRFDEKAFTERFKADYAKEYETKHETDVTARINAAVAKALEDYKREHDRVVWTSNDYEFYWRKNHQNDDFSVEKQAQEERKQYALRKEGKFTWINSTCPVCGAHSEEKTPYCPYCGSDLRRLGDV